MTGTVAVTNCKTSATFEWKIPDFFSAMAPSSAGKPIHSPGFSFSDSTWRLVTYYSECRSSVAMFLYLLSSASVQTVKFTLELRSSDGEMFVECSANRTFQESKQWGFCQFVQVQQLQNEANDLVREGILTVICHMKDIKSSLGKENDASSLKRIGLYTLSSNFRDLFVSKESCDVCLRVKDREFQAHRAILMARSPVFAAMFKNDTSEKKSGVVTIPDCDPDSFDDFLEYLYTGTMEEVLPNKTRDLYATADKYNVLEFKSFCVSCMRRNLAAENVCDVMTLADLYEETELMSSCQTFFNQNFEKIVSSTEWLNLMQTKARLAKKVLENMASKVKIEKKES